MNEPNKKLFNKGQTQDEIDAVSYKYPKTVRKQKAIYRICLGTDCELEFITKSKTQRLCHACRRHDRYRYL